MKSMRLPLATIFTSRNEVVAKVMFFTGVCLSTGGRVSASVHAGMSGPPTRQTPQDQAPTTPPGPGRPPQDQAPPGPGRPPKPPPDKARPPKTRHPPDQADPLDKAPPRPGKTPPDQADPPPGSRLQYMVYERPVRILLECILVYDLFAEGGWGDLWMARRPLDSLLEIITAVNSMSYIFNPIKWVLAPTPQAHRKLKNPVT